MEFIEEGKLQIPILETVVGSARPEACKVGQVLRVGLCYFIMEGGIDCLAVVFSATRTRDEQLIAEFGLRRCSKRRK